MRRPGARSKLTWLPGYLENVIPVNQGREESKEMEIRVNPEFSSLLPPLSTEEFEALGASIEADGVREPIIVDSKGDILDGHHRFKIAPDAPVRVVNGLTGAEKQAFVFQCNLARRNLSPSQKKETRARMKAVAFGLRKEDPKKNTQQRVAAMLGVAQQTVSGWFANNTGVGNTCTPPSEPKETHRPDARVKVPPKEREHISERVESGETQEQVAADYGVTRQQVSVIVGRERKRQQRKQKREETIAELGADTLNVHHGDFRQIGNIIDDGSIDLIFTDLPYDEGSVGLYGDLAAFAARVLRPGGWCLAYTGQTFLPKVLNLMSEHLTYGWIFGIQHSGGDLRYRKLRLQNKWKPIVAFYKPPLNVWWDWFTDFVTGGKEKADHEWQQAEGEASHFVRGLCPAKGIICDTFCGSGTTCVAAVKSGRRYVAFDIDQNSAHTTRVRLNDMRPT